MSEVILDLKDITKIYSNGVVANRNVSVDFRKGEIHSIVGENGAGKSTLMKIIFGIEHASSGTITYRGKPTQFHNSMEAILNGIGMVHQHFMLIDDFSVAENIVLGMEPKQKRFFLNKKEAVNVTKNLAKKYNFDMDVTQRVSRLTVSAKQKVEILKTLYRDAEVIILDEPTAVLTPQETQALFENLKHFKNLGHTILFISHKLNEVKAISDRITIMQNGESRGTYNNEDISIEQMTELIVGRKVSLSYDDFKFESDRDGVAFKVEGLNLTKKGIPILKDINFAIREGEILGVAGVQGNGQSELVQGLVGLADINSGKWFIHDQDISAFSVDQKRNHGLAYIPEDRMKEGVAQGATVAENLISSYYRRKEINGPIFMNDKAIGKVASQLIKMFSVRTKNYKSKIESLSGGNIQKVVVARETNTDPKVMIAEQPTRGIDIGSAEFIHKQLIDMRNRNVAILLVSADLNEVMEVSDRLIVMYEGEIVAHFDRTKDVGEMELGLYMLGVKRQDEESLKRASLC